jgi:hypothetical protein
MISIRNTRLLRSCTAVLAISAATIPTLALADEEDQSVQRSAPAADKGSWSMSTSLSYSRGDYGDIADTEVISAPVSVKYRKGNWRIKATTSWVRISGPGSLIQTPEGRDSGSGGGDFISNRWGGGGSANSGPGSSNSGSGSSGSGSSGSGSSGSSGSGSSGSGSSGGGSSSGGSASGGTSASTGNVGSVIPPTSTLTANRRSGLGDTSISLTYDLDMGNDFYMDVTGKVKLPTASVSKGLGTGRVDVTASVDLIKDVGSASFYVSGRRKFAGRPAGSSLRSTWGGGVGASMRTSRSLTIGADYDCQQSSFAGGQSSSEVTGWVYIKLNQSLGLTLYAGTGLNDASANFLGGATITAKF